MAEAWVTVAQIAMFAVSLASLLSFCSCCSRHPGHACFWSLKCMAPQQLSEDHFRDWQATIEQTLDRAASPPLVLLVVYALQPFDARFSCKPYRCGLEFTAAGL